METGWDSDSYGDNGFGSRDPSKKSRNPDYCSSPTFQRITLDRRPALLYPGIALKNLAMRVISCLDLVIGSAYICNIWEMCDTLYRKTEVQGEDHPSPSGLGSFVTATFRSTSTYVYAVAALLLSVSDLHPWWVTCWSVALWRSTSWKKHRSLYTIPRTASIYGLYIIYVRQYII